MNNELYHYGILGQKWGVRRYQNPDGTLTAEGKKRNSSNRRLLGPTEKRIIAESNKRRNQIIRQYDQKSKANEIATNKLEKNSTYLGLRQKMLDLSKKAPNSEDPSDWREWEATTKDGREYAELSRRMQQMHADTVNRILQQQIHNQQMQVQQMEVSRINNEMSQRAMVNAINAANMAASLSMTNGMNPFMFGMM